MGAFSDLMLEAKGLRAGRLDFFVDLDGYDGTPDRERWTCIAVLPGGGHIARDTGRTGEEAVRRVVDKLKLGAR